MKKLLIYLIMLLMILSISFSVTASFFLHEHDSFWWYIPNDSFNAVIPSTADRYIEKDVFGQKILEMSWNDGHTIMEVGSIKNKDSDTVRQSLVDRWVVLLEGVSVLGNRQITTSNNVSAYFYAVEGRTVDGEKGMLRTVYFEKDNVVVYLAMFLDSSDYQANIRDYWIRAVNEFEW